MSRLRTVPSPRPLAWPTLVIASLAAATGAAVVGAQSAASGAMVVRVTVLDPVNPVALADPLRPPLLARDPVTGRLELRVSLASAVPLETTIRACGGDPADGRATRVAVREDTDEQLLRVPIDDRLQAGPGGFEVRFLSRTGDAETTAIAVVSRSLLRAVARAPATSAVLASWTVARAGWLRQ